MKKKTIKTPIVKKKSTIKKKNYFDVVIQDKEGRTESTLYDCSYNIDYLVTDIGKKLSKLKLGQKLSIIPMQVINKF